MGISPVERILHGANEVLKTMQNPLTDKNKKRHPEGCLFLCHQSWVYSYFFVMRFVRPIAPTGQTRRQR